MFPDSDGRSGRRNAPPFEVRAGRTGDIAGVTLLGEFDLAAEDQFREAMVELGPGLSVLVIDLSELEFIDSIGVTLVLEQERRAEDTGCRFSVYLGEGPARRVFGLLGLDGGLIREAPPGRTPSG